MRCKQIPQQNVQGGFPRCWALSDSRTGLPGVSVQSWVCGEGIVSTPGGGRPGFQDQGGKEVVMQGTEEDLEDS